MCERLGVSILVPVVLRSSDFVLLLLLLLLQTRPLELLLSTLSGPLLSLNLNKRVGSG